MTTPELLQQFFGASASQLQISNKLLTGYANVDGAEVCVMGTVDGTYINDAAALHLAAHVIDCVKNKPGLPMVMLVDSAGQEPNRTAEMLGLPVYFGHLLTCLEVARQSGHKLVTVATGKAIGGAFICYGMFADAIYAVDTASVGLMPVEAMSAVTKIPVATLEALSKTLPALEFGAAPFALLGGVKEVWSVDAGLEKKLSAAIADATPADTRAQLGKERGGRPQAYDVQQRVLAESAR
ncbi:MAG: biotin-independent malonate decarboxylase subunit gamma [Terrimicrobiaceae bacterium]